MKELPFHLKLLDRIGRLFPGLFWKRYGTLARCQGFDRLYLLLSFDCDTPDDAQAAKVIDQWLYDHSVQRSYAVPGTMLEANPAIYKRIAGNGAEFLNHGHLPHTQQIDGVYRSTTFYADMEPAAVEEDIRKGHETVSKIIGREPAGFRAPHFGMVPLEMKDRLILPVLRDLKEYYSTQTTPFENINYGPIWWKDNWPEFPVSGSYMAPFSILDSYSYIESPAVRKVTGRYAAVLKQTVQQLRDWEVTGLLNIYVDPSHVGDDPDFRKIITSLCDTGMPSLTYSQALEICGQDIAD